MGKYIKGSGISVGASKTQVVVSESVKFSDLKNVRVAIELSAVAITNAITFMLLQAFDGTKYFQVGDQSEVSVSQMDLASATDIANATETFTETSHGRQTGQPVIFEAGTAGPTGLVDGQKYYVINVTANTFKLAESYRQAIEGVAVSISDDGTGTQTFYDAYYEIRMVESDSSDAAQLPLSDYVVVGCTTGASDSITVSEIYA